jgi:hypothetical protein
MPRWKPRRAVVTLPADEVAGEASVESHRGGARVAYWKRRPPD